MFIFLLQMRELFVGNTDVYLFAFASLLVWASWVLKVILSRRYRPWAAAHSVGSSVVIPVVDEPLDLFRTVLQLIVEQGPDEVIVVINGKRNVALENVCAEFSAVRYLWTPIPGKRNAVKLGVEAATHEIVVLVDSDTIWTTYTDRRGPRGDRIRRTLPELLKPFADPRVGGVTTRQRILEPGRSFLTRWQDWLENTRALYSMPAQSVLGQIGCLPGRTIAFRRTILQRCMDDFMTERFMNVFLEVSDDRTLTNYCLKQGYRTAYQYTSLVYTDAPLKLKKLFKQQLRWARGSQYNTLRMLPWMLSRAPMLAFFFCVDIILPFILVGAMAGWVYRAVTDTGTNFYAPLLHAYPGVTGVVAVVVLIVISSWSSVLVRQARHLGDVPMDVFRLPLFVLASTLFLMPVRIIGFLRLAHAASWGTRAGAYAADSTQTVPSAIALPAATLVRSREETQPSLIHSGGVSWWPFPDDLPPDDLPHSPHGLHGSYGMRSDHPTEVMGTASAFQLPMPAPARRRRALNFYAAIPYLIALVIFALEALVYV